MDTLRSVAVRVAEEAAEMAYRIRQEAVTGASVSTKSTETDVVTAGDRAAEQLVRDRLAVLRPGERILGEEGGGDDDLDGLRWVVDPIDGTVNYLYGFPWYAVSLAAQVDGVSVAGAVVEPDSGRVWSAARGGGAEVNGTPLRVSDTTRLDLALVATGFAYSVERRSKQAAVAAELLGEVRDIRRAGAASLDLCAVAAGWLDGYYEVGLNRWDWAAGALIAAEAGACVRLPGAGADGAEPAGDEGSVRGTNMLVCAAPGVVSDLTSTLTRLGACGV